MPHGRGARSLRAGLDKDAALILRRFVSDPLSDRVLGIEGLLKQVAP